MSRPWLAAVVVVLLVAGAVRVMAAPRAGQSWYDGRHGWRVAGLNIEETNDGGVSWRRLFRYPLDNINLVLRTGLKAGLYSETGCCATTFSWTNDGREFFDAQELEPAWAYVGEGPMLFKIYGAAILRVRPWPFPYRCIGGASSGRCLFRDRGGRKRQARFSIQYLTTMSSGVVGGAAIVPGGMVAVNYPSFASRSSFVPSAVFIRWMTSTSTRPRIAVAALPTGGDVTIVPCGENPLVEWPRLTVAACRTDGTNISPVGVWESIDGGTTYHLVHA